MNLKNYAFVALAIVGLAACKKKDSNNPEQQSTGEDTKISLSLSITSSGAKTYTPGDDASATVAELNMNTVDIFIYDNVSPFALTHKHLEDTDNASADFVTGINGERRLKNGFVIDAKTGNKLIYVGVNLPASYVTQIKAQGLASLDGVFSATELYKGLNDMLLSTGIAMFSNEGELASLEKTGMGGIPSANQVSFELTRMLAKVKLDGTDALMLRFRVHWNMLTI